MKFLLCSVLYFNLGLVILLDDEIENSNSDSLLSSLLLMSKHFDINTSAATLTASLPLVEGKLTPELFVRAGQRAGLVVKLVKRSLDKVSPLVLPVVINLKNNQSAVLLSINEKMQHSISKRAEARWKPQLQSLGIDTQETCF